MPRTKQTARMRCYSTSQTSQDRRNAVGKSDNVTVAAKTEDWTMVTADPLYLEDDGRAVVALDIKWEIVIAVFNTVGDNSACDYLQSKGSGCGTYILCRELFGKARLAFWRRHVLKITDACNTKRALLYVNFFTYRYYTTNRIRVPVKVCLRRPLVEKCAEIIQNLAASVFIQECCECTQDELDYITKHVLDVGISAKLDKTLNIKKTLTVLHLGFKTSLAVEGYRFLTRLIAPTHALDEFSAGLPESLEELRCGVVSSVEPLNHLNRLNRVGCSCIEQPDAVFPYCVEVLEVFDNAYLSLNVRTPLRKLTVRRASSETKEFHTKSYSFNDISSRVNLSGRAHVDLLCVQDCAVNTSCQVNRIVITGSFMSDSKRWHKDLLAISYSYAWSWLPAGTFMSLVSLSVVNVSKDDSIAGYAAAWMDRCSFPRLRFHYNNGVIVEH